MFLGPSPSFTIKTVVDGTGKGPVDRSPITCRVNMASIDVFMLEQIEEAKCV